MAKTETLQRGDQVPRFDVRTLPGELVSYSSIWQRRNLVLVTVPEQPASSYVAELVGRMADFDSRETACIMTRDSIAGVPAPAAIVADRWGEIVYVAVADEVAGLPAASELIDWIDYVRIRCAECEGEAR